MSEAATQLVAANQTPDFDRIDIDSLRRSGGLKWSMFPDAIGAFVAEMDFGTAPPITTALHSSVDAGRFGYLPKALAAQMSAAYAEWSLEHYGWQVSPDDVRPLADVVAAMRVAIEDFSRPGSPVILPTPAYMPFVSVPPMLGREVIQVPMVAADGRLEYDLPAIEAAFESGGQLLILCNPHNPIGRVLEPAEMTAISQLVDRHGGRVFSDEIHAPLVFSPARHVPYASISAVAAGHTLTATSASKAFNLPGLKCAQLILSNDADRELWGRIGMMPEHGAANLGVVANTAAYAQGAPWLATVLEYLRGSRALLADLVAELLPGVGFRPPDGTYLAWLDFRQAGLPDDPAAYFLEQAAVAMTSGAACGVAGQGFARLNFATPRPILRRAIEQLAKALPAS